MQELPKYTAWGVPKPPQHRLRPSPEASEKDIPTWRRLKAEVMSYVLPCDTHITTKKGVQIEEKWGTNRTLVADSSFDRMNSDSEASKHSPSISKMLQNRIAKQSVRGFASFQNFYAKKLGEQSDTRRRHHSFLLYFAVFLTDWHHECVPHLWCGRIAG